MWLTFYNSLCHRFSSPPPSTHSVDAAQLQRDEDHDDGEELPADRAVQEELQHRAAADLLQVQLLLEHLLQVRPVVPAPPQPPQSCRATVSQVNSACVCPSVCLSKCMCVATSLAGLLVSSLQQQEARRLGQEGQRAELQQGGEAIKAQQPGPVLPGAQQLAAGGHARVTRRRVHHGNGNKKATRQQRECVCVQRSYSLSSSLFYLMF